MIEAITLVRLFDILKSIKNLSVLLEKNRVKISAKHLVITSGSAIHDFLSGDTSRLKGPRTEYIYHDENEIFKFVKEIYRPSFKLGNNYQRWTETPVWKDRKYGEELIYRKIGKKLFESELKKHDPLVFNYVKETYKTINDKFSFSEFLQIFYEEDICGGGGIFENYKFKPVFIVALWIENLDEKPLKLKNYKGKFYYPYNGIEFRKESWGFGEEWEKELPPINLKKGESLLIPELVLLGEIVDSGVKEPFLGFHLNLEEFMSFDIYKNLNKLLIFGPSLTIDRINFEKESIEIHPFNSSNILRLSKDFVVGSCPFLFGFTGERFIFIKEILANSTVEEIDFSNFECLIIAELKDEISYFNEIRLVSDFDETIILYKDIKLKKGQYLVIEHPDNSNYKKLILRGSYQSEHKVRVNTLEMNHSKMKLIESFKLSDLELKKNQSYPQK